MSDRNNHRRLGDPLEYSPSEQGPKPGVQSGSAEEPSAKTADYSQDSALDSQDSRKQHALRKNDPGLGQPDFEPSLQEKKNIHTLSAQELKSLRQDQDNLRRQFEEKLLEFEKTGLRIPAAVVRILWWTMVFAGAVLGLFMVNQAVRFVGQISSLEAPWNIMAASLFLFFLAVILLVMFKVLARFLAFKKMARVNLKALDALAQRQRFQQLAAQKKEEAKKTLSSYLMEYRLEQQRISVPGLDSDELKKLTLFKQSLTDKKGHLDTASWLKEFEESFVHILDKAARKRIRAYARTVSLGTAASPVKVIDQMVVFYASLKLIADLLKIYNLRPAMGQGTAILSRAIIQAYLSGVIGEQSEAGVEAFSDYYESIFGEISFATGISAATDATRFILPKISEGALNGFLVWRLGRQAQKMIRPL